MQDIFVGACRARTLAECIVQNAAVDIVPRCFSLYFSTFLQSILMDSRNVSVPIGPNISQNVKLWAPFIAIIEQTGASGTRAFASPPGASHDDMRGLVRAGLFQDCRSLFHWPLQEME
jgi:hypothetical protein